MRAGWLVAMVLVVLAHLPASARADDIPGDCLKSFELRDDAITSVFQWSPNLLATTTMSCASAELLREHLFVAGSSMLSPDDLQSQPDPAKQRAVDAYNALKTKIENQPGPGVPQILFAAGVYVYTKYQFALCILSSESAGGTCWLTAAKFLGGNYKFFAALYQNQAATANKADMLNELSALKPDVTNQAAGPADFANARSRWIRTQVSLCRAIQQNCLK